MAKLVVKTVQARDLKSADSNGLSDPYVIVRFNDKKAKSKVVKRSLNPLWSEQFVFDAPGGAPSGKVSFTVMDWDRVGSDDFLGEFSIALGDGGVEAGKPKEAWYKLDGPPAEKVTGEVHAIVQWVAAGHGGDVPTLQPKLVAEGSGQLFVGVIEARNVAAKDASGTSDPLCKVHFNGQRYKTKQVMKTLSPVWHDEFYFEVPKAALGGAVLVEMFDWNLLGANDPMGAVSVPLGDMPDGGELDRWLPLVPQKKEKVAGELRLRLAYLSAAKAQMNARIADENYDALLRIVLAQDVVLISVLCDVYQSNEVAHVVVSIFEANNQAHRVLNQLLFREIKRTEQETTLFRTDSMATKSTRNYMKLIATTYLRDTLGPLIAEVLAAPAGSFEVDPSKVDAAAGGGGGGAAGAHGDVAANAKRLEAMCQRFFDAFLDSLERCPMPVRQLLGSLRLLVAQKFPDSQVKAVGGFYFLRFACPAIFTPEGFDLIAAPPAKPQRRALILISKVLQNLANGVAFGAKEQFMAPLNAFIERNAGLVGDFLERLALKPSTQMCPSARSLTHAERVADLAVLVRHLTNNFDKLKQKVPADVRVVGNAEKLARCQQDLADLNKILHP